MNRGGRTIAAALTALCLWQAAPAAAQQVAITDPAGDAAARGLDITSARVANRDAAVVVKVSFVRAMRGELVVGLRDRKKHNIMIVNQHRPLREDRTFAYNTRTEEKRTCRGMAVTWDHEADTATLRMPSRCFRGGDYGAISSFMLTEEPGGSDVDFAPENTEGGWHWTDWVPRG